MKMRRSALAVAVATSLTITAIPAAQASDARKVVAQEEGQKAGGHKTASGSSASNPAKNKIEGDSANETADDANKEPMHPALKAFLGVLGAVAGATAFVTLLGIVRTIVFNLFHV